MRRLDLVAGPNGAGKTTFVANTLLRVLPRGTLFVNADEVARHRWSEDPEGHSYEAAKVAADTREALIAGGVSFVAETVFSHKSKIELVEAAAAAGYSVHLHVVMVPVELSVARVRLRVAAGGHTVPEAKIRGRHERLWSLVAEAAVRCQAAVFYDNSTIKGPVVVARLAGGVLMGQARWPEWAATEVADRWPVGE